MARETIFPYYYPTTVVFVDDNAAFLESLGLQLPPNLAFKLFSNADHALEFVNTRHNAIPLYQRCITHMPRNRSASELDHLVHLDIALIEREVSNAARFRDISVVVVDYDMPELDGLEFCKSMQNTRTKKILFTGAADEKMAVRAFNEGIIDRFIMKSEADAMDIVNETIHELQNGYFSDISSMITSYLMLDAPGFIRDPDFQQFFQRLRHEGNFVEYYLVEDPSGFLLLTDQGAISRLLVLSEDEIESQTKLAASQGAPAHVIQALQSREKIPYFYETVDSYYDPESYEWDAYLLPAQPIGSSQRWYQALVEDPPVDIEFDMETANFNAYLELLDEELLTQQSR